MIKELEVMQTRQVVRAGTASGNTVAGNVDYRHGYNWR